MFLQPYNSICLAWGCSLDYQPLFGKGARAPPPEAYTKPTKPRAKIKMPPKKTTTAINPSKKHSKVMLQYILLLQTRTLHKLCSYFILFYLNLICGWASLNTKSPKIFYNSN